MLTLPIKRPWFDMIRSGEKLEEYRNATPYWHVRFEHLFGCTVDAAIREQRRAWICFRLGYGEHASRFNALVSLSYGEGRKEWGAEEGKEYFVLTIHQLYIFGKEV